MPPTRAWLLEELYKTAKAVFELDDQLTDVLGNEGNNFIGLARATLRDPEVAKIHKRMTALDDKQKSLIKMLDTVKV